MVTFGMHMAMNYNVALFKKINNLVGRSRWLDLFGKTGAEYVIVGMIGWYIASVYLVTGSNTFALLLRLGALPVGFVAGWLIDIFIGTIVQEPRPHVTYPESKLLFTPLMSWKSFPSDHAMAAWLVFLLAFMFNIPGFEMLSVLALWVCWGRVFAGCHYPFDTVGGFLVASFVSLTMYNLLLIFF